jgi:hypothetical protein
MRRVVDESRKNLFRPQGGIELSAHHYPVHDCTQQVVIAVSHGRAHERIDLALRYTRLVHGFGDRAKNAELLRILADELDADVGILGSCSGCPLSLGLSWGAHAS